MYVSMYKTYLMCTMLLVFGVTVLGGYTYDMFQPMMSLLNLYFPDLNGVSMLEFGNQQFFGTFPNEYNVSHRQPSKFFFERLGIKYVSIDSNGQLGALKLDVREPLHMDQKFDVITNTGFTEHVGEGDVAANLIQNQYLAFKALHDVGWVGSLYWHFVPTNHHWIRHGVCYYDSIFFTELMRANGYEVAIAPTVFRSGGYATKNMLLTMYFKRQAGDFITFDAFQALVPGLHSIYSDFVTYCDVSVDHEPFLHSNVNETDFQAAIQDICLRHYIDSLLETCIKIVNERCKESYVAVPNGTHDPDQYDVVEEVTATG